MLVACEYKLAEQVLYEQCCHNKDHCMRSVPISHGLLPYIWVYESIHHRTMHIELRPLQISVLLLAIDLHAQGLITKK